MKIFLAYGELVLWGIKSIHPVAAKTSHSTLSADACTDHNQSKPFQFSSEVDSSKSSATMAGEIISG